MCLEQLSQATHEDRGDRSRRARDDRRRRRAAGARRHRASRSPAQYSRAVAVASRSTSCCAVPPRRCCSPRSATTMPAASSRRTSRPPALACSPRDARNAHTRDVVMVTPGGQRTIIVIGEPLHPKRSDPLPWDELASCDAAYFTAQDPEVLVAARAAKLLVVDRTAPRSDRSAPASPSTSSSAASAIRAKRARSPIIRKPPRALVLTDGARGGQVETRDGIAHFAPSPPPSSIVGSYGAGDSFAGALVYFLATRSLHRSKPRHGPRRTVLRCSRA